VNTAFYRGIVLGKMKKHEEALNCFENIYRKHPKHMDAFFHKGMELAELGKHERALEIFDKLLQMHNDNVSVLYAMARSNAAISNVDKALYLLEQAAKKDRKTIKKWAIEDEFFDSLQDEPKFMKLIK
jgi:tetratricopeptide (TPR) repeat protein